MGTNRAKMFVTTLEVLETHVIKMRQIVKNDLSDEPNDETDSMDGCVINAFDEALEIALDARNEFCEEIGILIEDGIIRWKKSQAMKEGEAVNSTE